MAEHRIFVDNLRFTYEGPFNARDLFTLIGNFTYDRGFDKKQLKEFEYHTPTGKAMDWHVGQWKKITDYMRFEMPIRIYITDMTKKEVVVNGKRTLVDYGKVLIIFNAYMETDYHSRWEEYPLFQFMRTIYDKYLFKEYYERWEFILRDIVNQLYGQIQRFFNVYRTNAIRTEPNSVALHD